MLCAIWYHFLEFNEKNSHRGVLLLVKLQASVKISGAPLGDASILLIYQQVVIQVILEVDHRVWDS